MRQKEVTTTYEWCVVWRLMLQKKTRAEGETVKEAASTSGALVRESDSEEEMSEHQK